MSKQAVARAASADSPPKSRQRDPLPAGRKTLTVPETAEMLGKSLAWTHRALRNKLIPAVKVAGSYVISREKIEQFINGELS